MEIYLNRTAVTITEDLSSFTGIASASYRVLDQDGNELVGDTETTVTTNDAPGASMTAFVEITVPVEVNTLAPLSIREMRVVEIKLTRDDGSVTKAVHEYVVEIEEVLTEGINSFQNYSNAVLNAMDIPKIEAFNDAGKRDRIAAMLEARALIVTLEFGVEYDSQSVMRGRYIINDLAELTPEEYARLPKLFINALRRAQIMQANYLLLDENSDIEHLRQRGLLSNTVSESKQFFRTQKPIAKTLCERAMKELARWLVFNRRTARG